MKRKRFGRETRARPVRGEFEDEGRYWRCQNCGGIVDKEKHSTGDGDGVSLIQVIMDDQNGLLSDWDDLSETNWTASDLSVSDDTLTSSGANGYLYQNASVTATRFYALLFEVMEGDDSPSSFQISLDDGTTNKTKTITITSDWVLETFVIETFDAPTTVRVQFGGGSTLGSGKDVKIRYPRLVYGKGEGVETTELGYEPRVVSGCPHCGCENWDGKGE